MVKYITNLRGCIMSFILHSNFFDIIISILIVLNVVFTIILSIGDFKKDLNKCNNNDKLKKIQLFKLIVIIIYVIALAIIVMKIAKFNINLLCFFCSCCNKTI